MKNITTEDELESVELFSISNVQRGDRQNLKEHCRKSWMIFNVEKRRQRDRWRQVEFFHLPQEIPSIIDQPVTQPGHEKILSETLPGEKWTQAIASVTCDRSS